jgi:hypothetical protein
VRFWFGLDGRDSALERTTYIVTTQRNGVVVAVVVRGKRAIAS